MARKYFLISGVVVLMIALVLCSGCAKKISNPSPSSVTSTAIAIPTISVQDALNLIQKNQDNPDFVILDVRTADEFNSGHLAKALNIDYYSPDFKANVAKLDRHKEYLVYCRTGIRGAAATQIMLDLGFASVYNLTGGITQWVEARYPTTQ